MKKLLLIATLLGGATLIGNAQTISFLYQGKTLENGASVVYNGFTTETYGDTSGYIEYKLDPEIFITTDENVNVSVKVESNVSVQFCAFDGMCTMGTKLTKSNFLLEENKPENLLLDWVGETYDGSDIDLPLINMTITAWDMDNPSNQTVIYVTMGGFNTPVESITSDKNGVKVAGKTLTYELSSAANISIYSLSGKTIVSKTVNGKGTINLSNLTSGVYVYRVEGKNGKTGKFIIK